MPPVKLEKMGSRDGILMLSGSSVLVGVATGRERGAVRPERYERTPRDRGA